MATTLGYRLRIRNPADSADALIISSIRGGTNPYIAEPPSGDGQEIEPLTGAVRTGSYTVRILDAITSGTSRVLTSQLFDANGRQQMLSRRAYIELTTDNGATWTGMVAGYLLSYRLADALTWEVQVGDTRRIEKTKVVFDGVSTTFAKRGCLFGGPIVGGPWGPINDRGGWKFRVRAVLTADNSTHVVLYDFVSGYRGINDPLSSKLQDVLGQDKNARSNGINDAAQSYYSPNVAPFGYQGFPGLTVFIKELVGGANAGLFTPSAVVGPGNSGTVPMLVQSFGINLETLDVLWPAAITLPTVGDLHSIVCYTTKVCDASPCYLTEHPVDLVTKLWTDAGIAYDATAAATLRALMGDTLRVSMRVTQSTTLLDFLEKSLFGPFGFSVRTNAAGVLELFTTRLKLTGTPAATVNTNDLQGAAEVIFDTDEATVVSAVRYKTEVYWAYNPNVDTAQTHPLDSVYVAPNEVVVQNADVSTFSTKEIGYELQGMIHDAAGVIADMQSFTAAAALEIFDRFGHGAPMGEFAVLRTADPAAYIGDEVYLQPAHLPNLNKRLGDDPSVGARIVQIIRRTESPAGPLFKYADAGSAQQPVTPAATVSLAASATLPRSVAAFTITNAAAINAAAVLSVAVQWGSGAGAPSNGGTPFIRYNPSAVPTGAVQLPAVAPGSTVYVRVRTEQAGRRPSAWSAWVSVTLTVVAVPTGLSFTNVKQNAAQYNWTNANATDLIDVYAYQGGSPPADWTPYFITTMAPGSTSCVVRNLNGPTVTYQGAVFHRDPTTGKIGTVLTGAFTTGSTFDTIRRPAGLMIFPASQDASLITGIALGIYASDTSLDIVIQRAPDAGGSPGTFAAIATVRGSTEVYVDRLPKNGATYWYQIFHRQSGTTDSAATVIPLSATPGAIPSQLARPPLPPPAIRIQLTKFGYIPSTSTYQLYGAIQVFSGCGTQFIAVSSIAIYTADDPRSIAFPVMQATKQNDSSAITVTTHPITGGQWYFTFTGDALTNYTLDVQAVPNGWNVLMANQAGAPTDFHFPVPAANGSVTAISADLYGVVGNGVADDTAALNAAAAAAATVKGYIDCGSKCVKTTGAVNLAGAGIKFDRCSYGNTGEPGIYVTGTGFVALTISGTPTVLHGCVYGTGQTVDLVKMSNPVLAQGTKLRAYNADGYGFSIDKCWDCTFHDLSTELTGNASKYAFSMNDAGDTCNMTHIGRLQVETANQLAIYISPNSISLLIDDIHSEGITNLNNAVYAYHLGGGSCVYNAIRISAPGTSSNCIILLDAAACTFNSMRIENSIEVLCNAFSGGNMTLVAPNITGNFHELNSQTGKISVFGGVIPNRPTPQSNITYYNTQ